MAPPLQTRETGDLIPAYDHNDIGSYIEHGQYRVNTKSLFISGSEIIDANRNIICSGSVTLTGNLATTNIYMSGSLDILGNVFVQTGSVSSTGSMFMTNGSLIATVEYVDTLTTGYLPQGVLPVGSIPSLIETYLPQGVLPSGSIATANTLLMSGSLMFGNGDTGINEITNDSLSLITNGSEIVRVTSTKVSVPVNTEVYFDGTLGSTYFKYNSNTNKLELWVNGNKTDEWN